MNFDKEVGLTHSAVHRTHINYAHGEFNERKTRGCRHPWYLFQGAT